MNKTALLLIIAFSILSGCATSDSIVYDTVSQTLEVNGKRMNEKEALSFLGNDQNSHSIVTVRDPKTVYRKITVKEFNEELQAIVEAINNYYFPEEQEKSIFQADSYPQSPFTMPKAEPDGVSN